MVNRQFMTRLIQLRNGAEYNGWSKGRHRMRFGLTSDQHVMYQNGAENCTANYRTLKALGCEFVINCGDNTVYGQVDDWQTYLSCLSQAGWDRADVHEAVGNHEFEMTASDDDVQCYILGEERYRLYSNNGSLQNAEHPWFYIDLSGDRFIFPYMTGRYPRSDLHMFTTEELNWLEDTIESYDGTGNVWVIMHAPFNELCPGDDVFHHHYGNQMPSENETTYPLNYRFRQIVTADYTNAPNVIFCHGHTHVMPENSRQYNVPVIGNPEEAGCWNVHVPSGTAAREFTSISAMNTLYTTAINRVWCVDVYDNVIEMQLYEGTSGSKVSDMHFILRTEVYKNGNA